MRIPLVAMGFMYPEGYLRQQIRDDGWQENLERVRLIGKQRPISRVMDETDGTSTHREDTADRSAHPCCGMESQAVGRISLYLMDTDVAANQRPLEPNHQRSGSISGIWSSGCAKKSFLGIGGAVVLKNLGNRALSAAS